MERIDPHVTDELLRRARADLQLLSAATPHAGMVVTVDATPRVVAANRSLLALLQLGIDEVEGATLDDVVDEVLASELRREVALVRSTVETRAFDAKLAGVQGGAKVPVEVTLVPREAETPHVAVILRRRLEDQRADARAELSLLSIRLKELHEVTTRSYGDLEELLEASLSAGTRILGLETGIVSRIVGDTYTVQSVVGGGDAITEGDVYELGNTYCDAVARYRHTIMYSHVGALADMRTHPVYEGMALESYIGVPIEVDGEFHGTLNFSSTRIRHSGFQAHEIELIELMADGVGRLLENRRHELGRRRAEAALRRATETLAAQNRELEEFASAVAHDLKSPLTTIQGFAELLTTSRVEPADQDEFIERMASSARRMRELIDDLLELARAGRHDGAIEVVDLDDIAAAVHEEFLPRLEEAGGVITIGELPSVEAVPVSTRQLFQNLFSNAIKYRDPDRALSVDVTCAEVAAPADAPASTGRWFEITVADNGRGFDPADADRLFAPFKRLHATDTKGTGVGLPICVKVVERLGGRLTAEGRPGAGATFRFTVPERQAREELD